MKDQKNNSNFTLSKIKAYAASWIIFIIVIGIIYFIYYKYLNLGTDGGTEPCFTTMYENDCNSDPNDYYDR